MDPSQQLIEANKKNKQLKSIKYKLERQCRVFARSQKKLETQLIKVAANCKLLSNSLASLQTKYNKLKMKRKK